jgi:hypothetical protein
VAITTTVERTAEAIAAADTWNKRVALIRGIPEEFGKAQHQAVYSAVAKASYVDDMAPDFAYVHWRDEYELPGVLEAYDHAATLTEGFARVSPEDLVRTLEAQPTTLRIFRLLLGFTIPEFSASTTIPADDLGESSVSTGVVKGIEAGRPIKAPVARVLASVIDRAMRGELFPAGSKEVRGKIDKPDTAAGWDTVRKYAAENVPLAVFLHQRFYGGAFRQLLDATSGRRGDFLESAVEALFTASGIRFVKTGSTDQGLIAEKFGLTVKPAPDFVVHDAGGTLRAILECKQANDGGTARDKASRFASLRNESVRLGGIPVFAVLAGLGWRRTADTLGPVIRDTDGRVFTLKTLDAMLTVEPFPGLLGAGETAT